MSPTRISVVLSGGASLGAYQAGSVAALLVAVASLRDSGEDIAIDSLGGASAGALVAFLAAHGILTGRDPVALLHGAWVERVELDLLLGEGGAPLSFDRLREHVTTVLTPTDEEEPVSVQPHPLVLHVALTGLRGLRYRVPALRGGREVLATTYVDWSRYVLGPESGIDAFVEPAGSGPLDAVLASASNPGMFAPSLLDRDADRERYGHHGIVDLPDPAALWYSDGGLLQTEPIGRVIEAVRSLPDGHGADRLALLVDPRSEGPSGGQRFADPDARNGWLDGLGRALAIIPAQALYDDLRQVERDNVRLATLDRLVETIAGHLDGDAAPALRDLLRDHLAEERGSDPGEVTEADRIGSDDAAGALRAVVAEIAGLTGKDPVDVDVISPLLLADPDDPRVPALLAGEFLGDFGGFLSRDLRRSDFALGYASTRRWLDHGLDRLGVDDDAADAARAEVDRRQLVSWEDANRGRARLSDTSWASRRSAGRFAFRLLGALLRSVRPR